MRDSPVLGDAFRVACAPRTSPALRALLAGASGALSLRSAVSRRGRLRLPRLLTARAPSAWLAEQAPSLRSAATRRPLPPSPPAGAGGFTPFALPHTPSLRSGFA